MPAVPAGQIRRLEEFPNHLERFTIEFIEVTGAVAAADTIAYKAIWGGSPLFAHGPCTYSLNADGKTIDLVLGAIASGQKQAIAIYFKPGPVG